VSIERMVGTNQKHRMTHQRRVILEEIQRVNTHPTADEIYETVRKRLPKISLGTVYRNLEILSAHGLIQKIGPLSNQMRFDGITRKHYHLRCIYCGSVEDAPMAPMENLEHAIREKCDYRILDHKLEFIGICPRCRSQGNSINNNT
jgi:Fe2+ or Zn2+ uptake regulation protein